MADLITVQGTNKERRVILWETHPDHATKDNPEGEIFIAGEETAKVAKTAAVKRLLQSGALVEAKGKAADATTPSAPNAPFPGYDDLSMADITKRMETMSNTEKDAVRKYEAANKARKGIVEAYPWP